MDHGWPNKERPGMVQSAMREGTHHLYHQPEGSAMLHLLTATVPPKGSSCQVDVAHLIMRPPFQPGSYNRTVDAQIRRMTDIRQVILSYWEGSLPAGEKLPKHVILLGQQGLSWWQKALLWLPYRARKRLSGSGGRDWLIYVWQLRHTLARLRPKIIVCHDTYPLGTVLRQFIDWPCRLVLCQQGLSYYLDQGRAQKVYSLRSFDVVQLLTHASYHFDRQRMPAYEPLVTILPNSVNTETFQPASKREKERLRDEWRLPEGKKVVLLLSRLVPKKGAHLILQAWPRILQQVPDAYLWIVGGPDESWSMKGYDVYLQRLVQALNVSATVRLQGAIPGSRTASCYRAADLYVFPTVFVEGLALSLLEAMACGLPCIASEIDTTRELVAHGGVLGIQEPNLEDALVEPVVRVLQDGLLAQRLGKLARRTIERHYSHEVIVPRIREFYGRQFALLQGSGEPLANALHHTDAEIASHV